MTWNALMSWIWSKWAIQREEAQLTFTCSKSTIEILGKGVKYVQICFYVKKGLSPPPMFFNYDFEQTFLFVGLSPHRRLAPVQSMFKDTRTRSLIFFIGDFEQVFGLREEFNSWISSKLHLSTPELHQ